MNTDYFLFGLEFEFYLKDEDDKINFINDSTFAHRFQ